MFFGGLSNIPNKTLSPVESAGAKGLLKKKPVVEEHRKSKKKEDGGHHEAAGGGGHDNEDTLWLFSFNDMLFNLLLFFIVLFSISKIDDEKFAQVQEAMQGEKKPRPVKQEQVNNNTSTVIVGAKNQQSDPNEMGKQGGEAGGDKGAGIADAVRFMLERAENGKVKLAKGQGQGAKKEIEGTKKSKYIAGSNVPLPFQIGFSAKEFFLPKSAELSSGGKENLKQLALEVSRQKLLGRVEIEVHTEFSESSLKSQFALSTFADLRLSTARAGVIFEGFLKAGIPHKKVVSSGYADGRPIVSLENMTAKQREEFAATNERIVFTLKKEEDL